MSDVVTTDASTTAVASSTEYDAVIDTRPTRPDSEPHRPLRVLLLAPQPFFIHRGTPIAVRSLVQVLSEAGYEIDILTYHIGEAVHVPNCRVIRIPRVPRIRDVPPGFSWRKVTCDAVMAVCAASLLLRRRYDLIHAVEESAITAMFLGGLSRLPYVYDMDSSLVEQMNTRSQLPSWLHGLLARLEGMAVRRAAGVITCCRALADLSRTYAPQTPVLVLEDISLLPTQENTESPINVSSDTPVIMYVGNLEPYQGIDLLLEAYALTLQQAPTSRLVIVGGTTEHITAYRRRAEALGIAPNTQFLGPQPVDQLRSYLDMATIVVSPRIEGTNTPMKVYSYLDSGRPLLATRLATHTQVLDDTIACLVEPSPEAMAQGMLRLIHDPDYRWQLAAAAQRRVREHYSPVAYRRKLCDFYSRITKPMRPVSPCVRRPLSKRIV